MVPKFIVKIIGPKVARISSSHTLVASSNSSTELKRGKRKTNRNKSSLL